MPTARHILDARPRDVVRIAPSATVLEAARLMNDEQIGALVVTNDETLAGIVTERDIMRRLVAEQKDPATTTVADIMTTPVACASPDTSSAEMRTVMRDRRIRHLPVVDGNAVVGMISIGDLNQAQNEEQDQTIRYLSLYMSV